MDSPGSTDMFGWVFPNQSGRGAHVNVAAMGVNKENAVKFLEFMTSDFAQAYFANQNNEYAAVPGIGLAENPASLGLFRMDDVNLAVLSTARRQRVFPLPFPVRADIKRITEASHRHDHEETRTAAPGQRLMQY